MNYEALRKNSTKQYLGYCDQKGFIYSVQVDIGKYAVVALRGGEVTTLLTHRVMTKEPN